MNRPVHLTQADLQRYQRDGFVVVNDVFSPAEVEEMRGAFERLEQTARQLSSTQMVDGSQFVVDETEKGHRIHRVVWCGASEPLLSAYGRDERLLTIASKILGESEMDQLINQAHFKFPGDGVEFEWHQDSRHRRYGTDLWTDVNGDGSFVETATAIDPMTEDNGPLQFIPGSHRHGHLDVIPGTKTLPDDAFDPENAVTITMRPGSVALFGPYVIHGSSANTSELPRRLFLNGFAAPGANRRDYPGEGAGRRVRSS